MAMTWRDLLFAHWPVDVEALRRLVPTGLAIDTFAGAAWIGVVPFRMTGVRLRGLPPMPGPGAFVEMNVRTYVTTGDRAGVWFFSLDAADRKAVWAARRVFHLPYFHAEMASVCSGDVVEYRSRRRSNPEVGFFGRYKPVGGPRQSIAGGLEYFLTERYCLFSADRNDRIFHVDVQHQPWPLQPAEAEIERNTLTLPLGIRLPADRPLLHFAKRLDVAASTLES
jgi:uncharacterized protein YqjF (DUF2071 family)